MTRSPCPEGPATVNLVDGLARNSVAKDPRMTITARSRNENSRSSRPYAALARERLPARQAGRVEAFVRGYSADVSAETS